MKQNKIQNRTGFVEHDLSEPNMKIEEHIEMNQDIGRMRVRTVSMRIDRESQHW